MTNVTVWWRGAKGSQEGRECVCLAAITGLLKSFFGAGEVGGWGLVRAVLGWSSTVFRWRWLFEVPMDTSSTYSGTEG